MQRLIYRVRQFLLAHVGAPDPQGMSRVEKALSPALFDLFSRMLPFEQAHALRVFDRLSEQGVTHPDLLTAALLHDVGKVRYPLKPWERAVGVLVKKIDLDSPAEGILELEDVILSIDGVSIENDGTVEFREGERTSLLYLIQKKQINENLRLKVLRKRKIVSVEIKLSMPLHFSRLVPNEQYGVC